MAQPIEVEEFNQAGNLVTTYVDSPENDSSNTRSRIDVIIPKDTNSYARSFLNAFLPAGYPQSVTSDYLEYQIYDSLQAFSSSIAGLLSSRAVLEGIGVGDSHASPTAALLLSILQDSMGRIATIFFAHRLGTSLEPECKMYRLLADIFNDAAMILDCLSPAFPKNLRIILLSFSSVLRALCGVAAGSSKASLSAHFATQGNLGELNAKDSSQETVISLFGMMVGSLVVSHISSQWATWTSMIALLAIHLGTNYLAVRSVTMRTLNRQRANLLFSDWLEKCQTSLSGTTFKNQNHLSQTPQTQTQIQRTNLLLSPEQISTRERIFESDGVLRWKGNQILGYCQLGVPLNTILNQLNPPDKKTGSYKTDNMTLARLLDLYKDETYILWCDSERKRYFIVLKDGEDTRTQLKAWMHALFSAYLATNISRSGVDREKSISVFDFLSKSHEDLNFLFSSLDFPARLENAGWDTKIGAMETRSGTRLKVKEIRQDETTHNTKHSV